MEDEIASLRALNSELTLELSRSRNIIRENTRLRELLDFTQKKGVAFLPCRIISISLDEPLTSVLLDKGARDGITVYSPIVATNGLVGKVLEVDENTSLAELYTHAQFRAAAVVPAKGEMGILRSTGSTLIMTGLSMTTEVDEGDRVVTSGLGGVYPEGIPVGYVTAVIEDEIGIEKIAEVVPYVSLSSLFEVAVLLDEKYIDSDAMKLRRAKGTLMWLWETGPEGDR
jgi:rod shape-determining protein MreC